jgi:hypothetical protein
MRGTVKDQRIDTIKPPIGKGKPIHAREDNQACQENGSALWRSRPILAAFRRKGLVLWRPDTPLSPYPWRWCKVGADPAEYASPDKMLRHGNDESAAEVLFAECAQTGHLSLG